MVPTRGDFHSLTREVAGRIFICNVYVMEATVQTKLTLRLEKSLIDQAKAWADEKRVSLSHVVAMIFQRLTAGELTEEELHPFLKKIIGVAKGKRSRPMTDGEARKTYFDHLEEKYK